MPSKSKSKAKAPVTAINATANIGDECWRLYLQGANVPSIAKATALTAKEVTAIIEQCLEDPDTEARSPRAYLEKLVDEIHLVRQAAWQGWERSQQDKHRTTKKTTTVGTGGERHEETTLTERQPGDAAFLRILIDCNRRESTLRGLEKSHQIQIRLDQPPLDLDALILQTEAALAIDRALTNEPQFDKEEPPDDDHAG